MLNPQKKYNLEYYMGLVEKIVNMGAHIVAIKDSKFEPYAQDHRWLLISSFSGWRAQAKGGYTARGLHPQEVP